MQRDQHLPSLLLLPAPPAPASRESISAAYGPPLDAAIARAADPAAAAVLIVALACPGLLTGRFQYAKRVADWASAQSLAAGVYAVASGVCARRGIRAHANGGPGSVDARVVLLDHQSHHRGGGANGASAAAAMGRGDSSNNNNNNTGIEPNNTAVVDLATFAAAYHPWRTIFHCSTEAGLGLFSDYLRLAEGRQVLRQDQLVAVDGGLTMNVSAGAAAAAAATPKEADVGQHRTVCIGGTFDHLHAGHKLLLTGGALLLDMPKVVAVGEEEEGASSSEKPARFIVGVTGDELLRNKKHADLVEPWDRRARGVIDFLSTLLELRPAGWKEAKEGDGGQQEQQQRQQQQGAASGYYKIAEADGDFRASFRDGAVSVECVRIQDAFGPTITMPELSSLVVSAETRSGGQAVNDKRAELGWAPLQILEVDVLDVGSGEGHDGEQPTQTSDFASKISSTAIRQALSESRS